jgi:hypothetical protein
MPLRKKSNKHIDKEKIHKVEFKIRGYRERLRQKQGGEYGN